MHYATTSKQKPKNERKKSKRLRKRLLEAAERDYKQGFFPLREGDKALGCLVTMCASYSSVEDCCSSCLNLYFFTQEGSRFMVKFKFQPYFYVGVRDGTEAKVAAFLKSWYPDISSIDVVKKAMLDPDAGDVLSGPLISYLKISFETVRGLEKVKNDLVFAVYKFKIKFESIQVSEFINVENCQQIPQDILSCITCLYEYDIPYHTRFCIDHDVRCGRWYDVSYSSTNALLEKRSDVLECAEFQACAFDIETKIRPLKSACADDDMIMMISYMVNGKGYVIINKECVGENIVDLEDTSNPEAGGRFTATNVKDEEQLLRCWFSHMQEVKPAIYVTYGEDSFDWKFLRRRAAKHGFNMNNRYSLLPEDSHSLKDVTKAKLGYDLQVNPEDADISVKDNPKMLAIYLMARVVATHCLYVKLVRDFLLSLASTLPMLLDEALWGASANLKAMLLLASRKKAICPIKHPVKYKFKPFIRGSDSADMSACQHVVSAKKALEHFNSEEGAQFKFVKVVNVGISGIVPKMSIHLNFEAEKAVWAEKAALFYAEVRFPLSPHITEEEVHVQGCSMLEQVDTKNPLGMGCHLCGDVVVHPGPRDGYRVVAGDTFEGSEFWRYRWIDPSRRDSNLEMTASRIEFYSSCAIEGIRYYNAKLHVEFEFVRVVVAAQDAGDSGWMIHLNFLAKDKDDQTQLFFAELSLPLTSSDLSVGGCCLLERVDFGNPLGRACSLCIDGITHPSPRDGFRCAAGDDFRDHEFMEIGLGYFR